MLWLYVVIGVAALEVGFVLGCMWFAWCEKVDVESIAWEEDEEHRIRTIWLGVKTSLQTGRYIECHHRPGEFIRGVRVN